LKLRVALNITLHDDRKKKAIQNILKQAHAENKVFLREHIEESILSTRGGLISVKHPEQKHFCVVPFTEMTIDHRGNVRLCSDDFFSTMVFGTIKEKSVLDIWNQETFSQLRRDIRKGKSLPLICRKCMQLE
ncbi:MAG: SPASM domain-containing protein, partial [Nanoarchaeota archaeon]